MAIRTAGEFSRRSHYEVDISDFENPDIDCSDDGTLIIDLNILDVVADLPPKNQWTEHLVEYPFIAFINEKYILLLGYLFITMQLLGISHARVRKNGILEKWRFLGQILVENVWVRMG